MDFTLRDALYIGTYVSSITGLLISFKFRLKKTEDSYATIANVIFLDKGGLNIVTNDTCKGHRDQIHTSIRREASITNEAFRQISCLNKNIVKMMVHMKLEPILVDHKDRGEDE